jgi:hypothetical protein
MESGNMRFDEPDVREGYRRGARDCYESAVKAMKVRRAREIEAWLNELDAWQDDDPPPPPAGLAHF